MKLTIESIASNCGGVLVGGDPKQHVEGFSINTRTIKANEVFFSLKGVNTDGHIFIDDAFAKGAVAAVVNSDYSLDSKQEGALIVTDDTLMALQNLAAAYRRSFDIPVIAITGSVGKTTTKECLSLCLSGVYRTLKSEGNFNNEIGLPLSILNLNDNHEILVLEMGMRATGEISSLCEIARPGFAIITNVLGVHLETLGTIENIASAKCEVLQGISADGYALIHGDNPTLLNKAAEYACKKFLFGYNERCDFRIINTSITNNEMLIVAKIIDIVTEFKFPLPVKAWATNIIAAIGMAYLMGVDIESIKEKLYQFSSEGNRLNFITTPMGGIIINDTYNANPASMISALETGAVLKDKRPYVAILGDMFELGNLTVSGHQEVGEAAFANRVDRLILIGEHAEDIAYGAVNAGMKREKISIYYRNKDLYEDIDDMFCGQEIILVKASRGMRLEDVVDRITNRFMV